MNQAQNPSTLTGVKHLLAVASGKGGVGKSACCVNLLLMAQESEYWTRIFMAPACRICWGWRDKGLSWWTSASSNP